MLRQPDFITETMLNNALIKVKKKKPNPLYDDIAFTTMTDGQCIEILHVGPFDDEPASFAKMTQFAQLHGLNRIENCHREIYLNNKNRTEASKLKTILRWRVE